MPEQRHARVRIDALQSREKLVPVIRIGRRLVDVAHEIHQKGRLEFVDGRQFSALAPDRKIKRKSPWWKAFELHAVEQVLSGGTLWLLRYFRARRAEYCWVTFDAGGDRGL